MKKKVAFVTSGMRGLGTAICQTLARQGMQVVVGCGPTSTRQAQWLEEQRKLGFDFPIAVGDGSSWDSTVAAFAEVKRNFGEVDVLVNNAGVVRDVSFRKMHPVDWEDVIDTNLHTLFNVTKQVVDGMCDRGWGRIINISSVNAQKGQFGQTNYATAKSATHGFTKALALELAKNGVTVNTVSPGYIDGPAVKAVKADVLQRITDAIPMHRLGRPEEIASIVGWLASDDSSFATGANFSINGGLHMC